MKRIRLALPILLAMDATAGAAVAADPEPESPDLYEVPDSEVIRIVETASRTSEEQPFETPRAVSAVTRDKFDRRLSRTAPEALLEETGVFVQRSGYGGGAPIVRGQVGNRVLLLVDGIRLNNSTFRAGPNQILNTVDPLLVQRLELVRGTGAALYGSDAVGGTVNVITDKPSLKAGGGRPTFGLRLQGATYDGSTQAGTRGEWSGERIGVIAVASARHFGKLTTGGGQIQDFTGYDEWSAAMTSAARLGGGTLTASAQTTRQYDVPRTDRSTPEDYQRIVLQSRALAYLRYRRDGGGSLLDAVRLTASFQRHQEVTDRVRLARNLAEHDDSLVNTLGLQADVRSLVTSSGELTWGGDLYADFVQSRASAGEIGANRTAAPEEARYPAEARYQGAAAFISHTQRFGAPFKLGVQGRAGVSRVWLPEDGRLGVMFPMLGLSPVPERAETTFIYAGELRGRLALRPELALFGGIGLGFRAPNVDDYGRMGPEGQGFLVPGGDLRPERAYETEIGAKLERSDVRASVAYAFTYLDDALARRPSMLGGANEIDGDRVLTLSNADWARYHSIEGEIDVALPFRLVAGANGAFTFAEQRSSFPTGTGEATYVDEPASKVPPAFATLFFGWHGAKASSEAVVRGALWQHRLSEIDLGDPRICPDGPDTCAGSPAWTTVSLRGGYRWRPELRVTLVAENLLDARYRMHGSGIDGPGRGIAVMVDGAY